MATPGTFLTQTVAQLRQLARQVGLKRPTETSAVAAAPWGGSSSTITFVPQGPQWAAVTWWIAADDRQRAAAAGARELCLRMVDVTGLPAGSSHPQTLQDVVVPANASEWHLAIPLCGRDYRVELGYRLTQGGWFRLATSAAAWVPADGLAALQALGGLPFTLEEVITPGASGSAAGGVEHERLYQWSTATSARLRRMGSEVLHELDRPMDTEEGLNASGAGPWASGRSESGMGLMRQRSFWLVADAELIVYGATDPSASLSIGSAPVDLKADGSFRVQVPFKDGEQHYPIRAVAADGQQQRSVHLAFQRQTPDAKVNLPDEAEPAWF